MIHDRLKQLLDYHDNEPNDPFIIYGIALEYQKTETDKAVFYFDLLLEKHQEYLATYYHAGHLFHDLQEISKAKKIYEDGIELAKKQQNSHALRELSNAYQNFLFEEDLEE